MRDVSLLVSLTILLIHPAAARWSLRTGKWLAQWLRRQWLGCTLILRLAMVRTVHRFRPMLEPLEDRTVPAPNIFTVTDNSDDPNDTGSIRYAFNNLNGDVLNIINFDPTMAGKTITLTNGALTINTPVQINGLGASQLTISGNNTSQVFIVASDFGFATISGLTITGGNAGAGDGGDILNKNSLILSNDIIQGGTAANGGGIASEPTSVPVGNPQLSITNCTFTGNVATTDGGALYNNAKGSVEDCLFTDNTALAGAGIFNAAGTLTVDGSTFSANSATGTFRAPVVVAGGAGIYNTSGGTLTLTDSTLTGNTSVSGSGAITTGSSASIISCTIVGNSGTTGGGILIVGGAGPQIGNTIVADNSAASGADVQGLVNSLGINLISDSTGGIGWLKSDLLNQEPLLGPLQNNGGPTPTMALLPGSPALLTGSLAVDNEFSLSNDQRGLSRSILNSAGTQVDIGAVQTSQINVQPFNVKPVVEGNEFSARLASMFDSDPNVDPSGFSATINWGDGTSSTVTTTASSGGQITRTEAYIINGIHTYAEVGTYTITITVTDSDNNVGQNSLSVQVGDAALHPTGVTIAQPVGVFNGVVATFTDDNPLATTADFPLQNIIISWGDGSGSNATAVTQPGGPGTTFFVYGTHTYPNILLTSTSITITDVDGSTATTAGLVEIGKGTPTLRFTSVGGNTGGTPTAAAVAVAGFDEVFNPTLQGVAPTVTYFVGDKPIGTPLSSPPVGVTYTVVATFPGSADYTRASISAVIIPQVAAATVQSFSGGQTGSLGTVDGTVQADLAQRGPNDQILVVSLERYSSDPNAGQSTVSQSSGQNVVNTPSGNLTETAAYDVKVSGALAGRTGTDFGGPQVGDVLVVKFAIPPGGQMPVLFYAVPGTNPAVYLQVPASMIQEVGGFFEVTFTATTPVTIFDLTQTVFTIADLPPLPQVVTVTPTIALVTPTGQANESDDLLGSHGNTDTGSLVGIAATTQVTQTSVTGSGGDDDSQRQVQQFMNMFDGVIREFHNIFGTQLQLLTETLLTFVQSSLLSPTAEAATEPTAPAMEQAEPTEPAEALAEVSSTDSQEIESQKTEQEPQQAVAEVAVAAPSAASAVPAAALAPGRLADLLDREVLSCLALSAMPLLPMKEPPAPRARRVDKPRRNK
jgi:predicted outer membrane repeat protein